MKPKVFLYEEQLLEVLNSNMEQTIGVAYEWKEEGVFHIYTKPPQVAPTGYPAIAYIRVFDDFVAFQQSKELFYTILQEQFPKDGAHKLMICLYQGPEKLEHKAYLFEIDTVVDCAIHFVPLKSELYSRSKGLLEIGVLEESKVLIIGLGSFGSNIAIELAKAGVGHFVLVDFDFLELHNLSRHQCGINDLGRYKTKGVRDLILQKNPFAKVETHEVSVIKNFHLLHTLMAKSDLVICTTDNNTSRFAINQAAIKLQKTVIFGRAITRAEGGDVFILKPNIKTCYACLINDDGTNKYSQEEEISTAKQLEGMLPAYITQQEKETLIQVGLSSDIMPICTMVVKLSLSELNLSIPAAMPILANELTYNYYFWANRRSLHYTNYFPFNDSKGNPTILKWYGAHIPANENCTCCN